MTIHADLAAEWRDAQDKIAALTLDNIDLARQLNECKAQPVAVASPSGEPMPTGDLPGWRYLLGEDFDTAQGVLDFGASA